MCYACGMMKSNTKDKFQLALAMLIFGTIGPVRRLIPVDSMLLAMMRAFLAGIALYVIIRLRGRRLAAAQIRPQLWTILLVGVIMGFNWVFLFEAFKHTSVAVATVCYYMEPVFIILASPFVFREKLTLPKMLCVAASFLGMVLVSGVLETGFSGFRELKGVAFGLLAGLLYATCVIWNKTIRNVPIMDRTLVEFFGIGFALLPFVLFSRTLPQLSSMGMLPWILLLMLGIFHTGITYGMYYNALDKLPSQTVAFYSYLDPVLAVIISEVFLHEHMSPAAWIGSVLIIGSALVSDLLP